MRKVLRYHCARRSRRGSVDAELNPRRFLMSDFPPLSFLLGASANTLAELELAALNRRANLGKAVRYELEQWIEQSAAAMLVRWMIENRAMDIVQQSGADGAESG